MKRSHWYDVSFMKYAYTDVKTIKAGKVETKIKTNGVNGKNKEKPRALDSSDDDSHEGESLALARKRKISTPGTKVEKTVKTEPKEKLSKPPKKRIKAESSTPQRDDGVMEGEDEAELKWFERAENEILGDGSQRWKTLEHNGVLFPDPYSPLPSHVRLVYDGQPIPLPPEAEEVAGFFAALLESDHAKNPTFQRNFFEDFKEVCKQHGVKTIKSFDKCDFGPMFRYFEEQREMKKNRPAAEKKEAKRQKDVIEEMFKTCMVDGHKETVGNFRVEPPGLFRGRGAHPKTGKLKTRVQPEQIIINIGSKSKVPSPPAGHKWGEVRHDNTVTWLCMWRENINGAFKYVFLSAGSKFKGQSDVKKYEKARTLKKHIVNIRKQYNADLKHELMQTRQRATAMALIDLYALRAGNEKGEDEADTVGCCSLRVEHITLYPPNKVLFDFLGKDSIRYVNEVEVDQRIFKNLKIFKRPPKVDGSLLFDRLNTGLLNKHLDSLMPGLSAKVFRTYNASHTMQNELLNTPSDCSVAEKLLAYNRANRQVAILCNHQRTVPKAHESSIEKASNNVIYYVV